MWKFFSFTMNEKKVMIGMKFRHNLCQFLLTSLVVIRVLPEFSCRSISLLNYNFYIATRANFLGVFLKKPHRNWYISRQSKRQLAHMGPNYVSRKLVIWSSDVGHTKNKIFTIMSLVFSSSFRFDLFLLRLFFVCCLRSFSLNMY